MKGFLNKVVFISLLAVPLSAPAQESTGQVARWDFDVYLDDRKVGNHRFRVSEADGVKQVQSEAEFTYRILFIPAYEYEHRAAERWSGNCLLEFNASTNANGRRSSVSGAQGDAAFVVEKNGKPAELPGCVMTFAYWNPDFLDEHRLLNPQTGEYLDVEVRESGDDTLMVRGQPVRAKRFRLTARNVDLTLWYSLDDEWLALESVAKGGRIIRYELS